MGVPNESPAKSTVATHPSSQDALAKSLAMALASGAVCLVARFESSSAFLELCGRSPSRIASWAHCRQLVGTALRALAFRPSLRVARDGSVSGRMVMMACACPAALRALATLTVASICVLAPMTCLRAASIRAIRTCPADPTMTVAHLGSVIQWGGCCIPNGEECGTSLSCCSGTCDFVAGQGRFAFQASTAVAAPRSESGPFRPVQRARSQEVAIARTPRLQPLSALR